MEETLTTTESQSAQYDLGVFAAGTFGFSVSTEKFESDYYPDNRVRIRQDIGGEESSVVLSVVEVDLLIDLLQKAVRHVAAKV